MNQEQIRKLILKNPQASIEKIAQAIELINGRSDLTVNRKELAKLIKETLGSRTYVVKHTKDEEGYDVVVYGYE